jgi:hypothetical protein
MCGGKNCFQDLLNHVVFHGKVKPSTETGGRLQTEQLVAITWCAQSSLNFEWRIIVPPPRGILIPV